MSIFARGAVRPRPKRRSLIAASLASLTTVAMLMVSYGLSASSAATSHAKAPFVFGISYAESGPLAPPSNGASEFIGAWFSYVNSMGGVQGHKVDLTVLDDTGDPGKALLNVETLWSQDHVLGLIGAAGTYTPWAYIKQNNIPVWSLGGGTGSRGFGSYYSTWFPTGSVSAAWDSQAAYWSVKIEHKHPKVVAVLYATTAVTWNTFVQNYWTKLGATTVEFDAGSGTPSTDCTALVLKWKSEGVQYLDWQDNEWPSCLLAEQRLGWKPPDGEGSPSTSQPGEAELLGRVIVGVIAGSPNSLYTGAPIYSSPNALDKTYEGNIRKYVPQFANYAYLNSTAVMSYYGDAMLVTTLLNQLVTEHKAVTSANLISATQHYKNWSTFTLDPPVESFAANCKTGGDGTIWGYWHFNPKPTAIKPQIYMVPASGPNWVNTRSFLGLSKCYLTAATDQLFPNG